VLVRRARDLLHTVSILQSDSSFRSSTLGISVQLAACMWRDPTGCKTISAWPHPLSHAKKECRDHVRSTRSPDGRCTCW
jgi:hypothetical protein